MSGFFRRLFSKFRMNRSLEEAEKIIDAAPGETVFKPIQRPFGGEDVETVEEHSVTDIYNLMGKQIDSAIEAKQQSGAAAARVTNAIGGAPVPASKKEK